MSTLADQLNPKDREIESLKRENRELKASIKRLSDALVRVNGEAVNVLRFEAELANGK